MRLADLKIRRPAIAPDDREPGQPPVYDGLAALVQAAGAGDETAWGDLVDRFSPMLWAVARSTGLGAAEAGDVCQTTWLRLLENMDRIEQPERVAGWLATTVRREAIRTSRRAARVVPTDEDRAFDALHREPPPVLPSDATSVRQLRLAIGELPERSRTLIALFLVEPPMAYSDIARTLGMPIGSIGPTRARILATVRAKLERRGISAEDVASE